MASERAGACVKAVDAEERAFLMAMRQHLVGMTRLIEKRLGGIAPPRSEKVLEPEKEDRARTRTYHRE